MLKHPIMALAIFAFSISISSCKKIKETNEIIGNQIPYYDEVPTIKVENYLNRMYVDLIGREPLDQEMIDDIAFLRSQDLSFEAREKIAIRLQTDTTARPGEGSYKTAYYHWFYERMKADLLESANQIDFDEFIPDLKFAIQKDSIKGDSAAVNSHRAQLKRLTNVLDAELWYQNGTIEIKDMVAFMLDNQLYDKINMQSFNFINATFDNLFYRFPTAAEYNAAFNIVEYSKADIIMGRSAQNKGEYIAALVDSREFYAGMIIRGYHRLMVREPSSAETAKYMGEYFFDHDYLKFQRHLIKSDEYAQFIPTYR